jgi:hypothetical protein
MNQSVSRSGQPVDPSRDLPILSHLIRIAGAPCVLSRPADGCLRLQRAKASLLDAVGNRTFHPSLKAIRKNSLVPREVAE